MAEASSTGSESESKRGGNQKELKLIGIVNEDSMSDWSDDFELGDDENLLSRLHQVQKHRQSITRSLSKVANGLVEKEDASDGSDWELGFQVNKAKLQSGVGIENNPKLKSLNNTIKLKETNPFFQNAPEGSVYVYSLIPEGEKIVTMRFPTPSQLFSIHTVSGHKYLTEEKHCEWLEKIIKGKRRAISVHRVNLVAHAKKYKRELKRSSKSSEVFRIFVSLS